MKTVALMFKAPFSGKKESDYEKEIQVSKKLKSMKLAKTSKNVENGIEDSLTYMDFSTQHLTQLKTNNTIERLNRELNRWTKAIALFPVDKVP